MELLCKSPYVLAGRAFGCGQCMPCRFNRRRIWTHRIMLEAGQYTDNAFVTLTYDDEHLPSDGSVVPSDLQKWLKRLRKAFPNKVRFFGVGEYGEQSWRPHYHVALFNYPTCSYGMSTYNRTGVSCCAWCRLVENTWKMGRIQVACLEQSSAGYIAGYVTKKMTAAGDSRLEGRHPEFSRMSLRPGIGGDACWEIADVFMRYDLNDTEVDVPGELRHGVKKLPLGRYLQRRVREFVGREPCAPDEVVEKIDAEMLPLRLAAKVDAEKPSLKHQLLEVNRGRIAGFEARQRIYRQRKDSL